MGRYRQQKHWGEPSAAGAVKHPQKSRITLRSVEVDSVSEVRRKTLSHKHVSISKSNNLTNKREKYGHCGCCRPPISPSSSTLTQRLTLASAHTRSNGGRAGLICLSEERLWLRFCLCLHNCDIFINVFIVKKQRERVECSEVAANQLPCSELWGVLS